MPLFFTLMLQFIAPALNSVSNFFSWAPRLAIARLMAKWRSLLTIIIGVILGAGIGALIPLYSNAVGQIGMVQRLASEPLADAHAQVRITLKPAQDSNYNTDVAFVDDTVRTVTAEHITGNTLDRWVDEINPYIKSSKMGLLDSEGEPIESTRASIVWMNDWEKHVRVVQGELPSTASVPEGADFNVAIPLFVANELDLSAGEFITIDQRLENTGRQNPGAHASSRPFVANIVAIVAPQDEQDPFWMALDAQENVLTIRDGGLWRREIALFATEADTQKIISEYIPATDAIFGWRIIFNHDNLSYSDIKDARLALRNLNSQFLDELVRNLDRELGYRYHTRLVAFDPDNNELDRGILQDYATKQQTNFVPFALLLIQVGGLVIFFLVVTAALVRRGERREIAMLQSRGAWDSHILALRGIEAFIIMVFGALVAPLLAQQLLIFLGPTIGNTSDFPLPLTRQVFLFSFIAGIFTFVALMASMLPVLNLPLISAGGASLRSSEQNWIQKYYIDVILVALGFLFLWRLLSRDTPLVETSAGGKRVDFLMLASPIFLMTGVGIFALRFFPMATTSIARASSRGRGLMRTLASWQVSREPLHYGRVTFLLALAISIGWFATSFRATVHRSQADQAHYLVGTDARIYERDTQLQANRARPEGYYEDHDGIESASLAHRVPNLTFVVNQQTRSVNLLAIDPRTFGDVVLADWRADLGNLKAPYPANDNFELPAVGQSLPATPTKISMWVRFDRLLNPFSPTIAYLPDLARLVNNMTINLRLQDENGTWVIVPMEAIRAEYLRVGEDIPGLGSAAHITSGWVYYEVDLSTLKYQLQGDTRLVSIFWEHRTTNSNGERRLRLLLADMTIYDADGIAHPWEGLTESDWSFVEDAGAEAQVAPDDIHPAIITEDLGNNHTNILSITFDQFALWSRMGINTNYPTLPPLTAVVSESFRQALGMPTVEEAEADPAAQNQGAEPGEASFILDNVNRVSVRFRTVPSKVVEYFPSLYDSRQPFVIADIRELMYAINQRPSATFYPDEVWLKFTPDIDSKGEVDALLSDISGGDNSTVTRVDEVTYAQEFDQLETDPLALGLLGLMFLAFIIALALSIVGLLTYAALTAQSRRNEFGVLRALGLSSRRVVTGLLLEQFFVVVIAAGLGTLLGYVLSVAVVPTLALGTTGDGVVPPFINETEWSAIGNFALIMGLVLAGVFAFTFFIVRQLSLSRTLRLGDE